MDLDLLVATDPENEAKVYQALASLPDRAVLELAPGEIAKYTVVRVGDEPKKENGRDRSTPLSEAAVG